MTTYLALDPGPKETGLVVWSKLRLLPSSGEAHRLMKALVLPNDRVLDVLRRGTGPGSEPWRIVIEMVASYGMAVGASVFETCVWIGRFKQAAADPNEVRLVYRREVKLHLCGSVKAKEANIWQALVDRFGPPGTKAAPGLLYGVTSHARAALALAVTASDVDAGVAPAPLVQPTSLGAPSN